MPVHAIDHCQAVVVIIIIIIICQHFVVLYFAFHVAMPSKERASSGSGGRYLSSDPWSMKPLQPAWASGVLAKEKPMMDARGKILPPDVAIHRSGWVEYDKKASTASSSSTGD